MANARLPSCITIDTLKTVLALTPRHRRLACEQLSKTASSNWRNAQHDEQAFYDKLRILLDAREGLLLWEETAKQIAPESKRDRCSLISRVMAHIVKLVDDPALDYNNVGNTVVKLRGRGQTPLVALLLWARISSGDDYERTLALIEDDRELAEAMKGMVTEATQISNVEYGNAVLSDWSEVVRHIKDLAAMLRPDRVEHSILRDLETVLASLADIARAVEKHRGWADELESLAATGFPEIFADEEIDAAKNQLLAAWRRGEELALGQARARTEDISEALLTYSKARADEIKVHDEIKFATTARDYETVKMLCLQAEEVSTTAKQARKSVLLALRSPEPAAARIDAQSITCKLEAKQTLDGLGPTREEEIAARACASGAADTAPGIVQAVDDVALSAEENSGQAESADREGDYTELLGAASAPTPQSTLVYSEAGPSSSSKLLTRCFALIHAGRTGIAYHVGRMSEDTGSAFCQAVATLSAASDLDVAYVSGDSERLRVATRLLLEAFSLEESERRVEIAKALAASAVTIWPTAFFETIDAGREVLACAADMLRNSTPSYASILEIVADCRNRNVVLTPALLLRAGDHSGAEERITAQARSAEAWLDRERHSSVIFQASTRVWHRWLTDRNSLGGALEKVAANRRDDAASIRNAIEAFHDDDVVDDLIRRTDRDLRGHRARRNPIEARAIVALRQKVCEARSQAALWLDLIEHSSPPNNDYKLEHVRRLHGTLQSSLALALKEITEQAITDDMCNKAALLAHTYLERFGKRLNTTEYEPPKLSLTACINGDLLSLSDIELDEAWEVRGNTVALARLEDENVPNWKAAFDARLESGDHVSSAHLYDLVTELRLVTPDELMAMAERREESVQQWRRRLAEEARAVKGHVEEAVSLGLLTEIEREEYLARINAVERTTSDISQSKVNFSPLYKLLSDISVELSSLKSRRIQDIKDRLKGKEFPESARERIITALANEQIPVAEDYIERLDREDPLPDAWPVEQRLANSFYESLRHAPPPESGGLLTETLEEHAFRILGDSEHRSALTSEGQEFIRCWCAIRSASNELPSRLRAFFELLGFTNVRVANKYPTPKQTDQEAEYSLTARPISDRTTCPIPKFGSEAHGSYRILLVRKRASLTPIFDAVSRSGNGAPILVLFCGQINQRDRATLRGDCQRRSLSFLVIDDYLVSFLSTIDGSRLSALFECCLPFTWSEPYVRQLPLPPEMFYGRSREVDRITARTGDVAYLVYGGRQLGKTAILKQIEERYKESTNNVVRYIDLKVDQVGAETGKIWAVLGRVLSTVDGFRGQLNTHQRVRHNILSWLMSRRDRSILFLLDEADAFLEADAKDNYTQIAQLKALVLETDARFKVVFAGLHNVQRASRDPNTPIAHFGEAIAIGPLFKRDDLKAAESLVNEPLCSLGYYPEHPDVVTSILAHTNYYPSLIQIFCFHLLQHMQRRTISCDGAKLGIPISQTDVEEVYKGQRLAPDIRHRFDLTIQLDPRYELITLLVAKFSRDNTADLVHGLPIGDIRDLCLDSWSEGFAKDDSHEGFRTLADELVDLGVLRVAGSEQYALRNANVLMLLGTENEIDKRLSDVRRRVPPAEFDPGLFRCPLDGTSMPAKRSPFYSRQISRVFNKKSGVTLLWGLEIAGLKDVRPALNHRQFVEVPGWRVEALAHTVDLGTLRSRIQELRRAESANLLLVLHAEAAWSPDWIGPIFEEISAGRSRDRVMRVLAVGDAEMSWRWFCDPSLRASFPNRGSLSEIFLEPWARGTLEQLQIDELDLLRNDLTPERFDDLTGRWGPLLAELAGIATRQQGASRSERVLAFEQQLRPRERLRDCLRIVEEQPVFRALSEYGSDLSFDELVHLAESDSNDAQTVCEWAESLSLLRRRGDRFRLDPILRRALQQA